MLSCWIKLRLGDTVGGKGQIRLFIVPTVHEKQIKLECPSSISIRTLCMVGAAGFEPAASWSRTKRATKLRYAPLLKK